MDLSYESKEIFVTIDGVEYRVADRTDETEQKLAAHDKRLGTVSTFESDYELIEILLGREAAAKIFPLGKKENLTRLAYIALGVLEAYNAEINAIRERELEKSLSSIDKMAERAEPVIEMMNKTAEVRSSAKALRGRSTRT
jgi:hypothetical protein